jgi:hypothetical protein
MSRAKLLVQKGTFQDTSCATVKICIKEVIKAGKTTHFKET